jgi:hypothetical protein
VPALTLTAAERVAIYSAVAHYHFDPSNQIIDSKPWPVIFVSPRLGTRPEPGPNRYDGDPTPAELLPLLRDLSPRVESAALLDVIEPSKGNAVREDGIWIGFGNALMDGSEVTVRMESFVDGKNAVGYEYRLARQGGGWVVTKAALSWVS